MKISKDRIIKRKMLLIKDFYWPISVAELIAVPLKKCAFGDDGRHLIVDSKGVASPRNLS